MARFLGFSHRYASVSTFSQQIQKLLLDAMDYFFHSFNDTFSSLDTYRGLCLLACDGSDLAIAHNPNDKDNHRCHNSLERNEKGYNQLHLNALSYIWEINKSAKCSIGSGCSDSSFPVSPSVMIIESASRQTATCSGFHTFSYIISRLSSVTLLKM